MVVGAEEGFGTAEDVAAGVTLLWSETNRLLQCS